VLFSWNLFAEPAIRRPARLLPFCRRERKSGHPVAVSSHFQKHFLDIRSRSIDPIAMCASTFRWETSSRHHAPPTAGIGAGDFDLNFQAFSAVSL
jgi:hypothetical protein